MSGRHAPSGAASTRAWAVGLGAALVAVLIAMLASSPAGAATTTINAQLSLSGLADSDNPVGGSQIGVHPGDRVNFTASTAPTAGLDQLGLSGLVGGLLGSSTTFQITADFSRLPGGHANTTLSGSTSVTFRFPSTGTYHFTWTAQSITVGLLGRTTISTINLDGNQLAQAGIRLNASNQYVGAIVVATNPPKGGISVQLPSVHVAPSAPVVGQLPTVSIPGVQLPTAGASVPNLLPGGATSSSGGKSGASTATAPSPANTYKPAAELVPDMVVPHGDGGGAYAGSGGGFALDTTNGGGGAAGNQLTKLAPGLGAAVASGRSSAPSGTGSSSDGTKPIDLASSPSSPSGELPVLLAILAIVALAIVAGTYARLYLLGRSSSAD